MRKSILWLIVLLLPVLFSNMFGQDDMLYWDGNTDQLLKWLSSENDHHKIFALQTIIANAGTIGLNSLAHDIYTIFRTHKNDKVRQMALVALYKTQHYFVLKNLEDDLYREKNPEIRRQITCILDKMPVLAELN